LEPDALEHQSGILGVDAAIFAACWARAGVAAMDRGRLALSVLFRGPHFAQKSLRF
jgi:hypothetical protein